MDLSLPKPKPKPKTEPANVPGPYLQIAGTPIAYTTSPYIASLYPANLITACPYPLSPLTAYTQYETKPLSAVKAERPFKSVTTKRSSQHIFVPKLDPDVEENFQAYRRKMLGSESPPSPTDHKNMRRNVNINLERRSDPEYLEKRRKNNEAAKRSREARKAKEDELAIRVSFLEKENLKMKFQLAELERERKVLLMRIDASRKC